MKSMVQSGDGPDPGCRRVFFAGHLPRTCIRALVIRTSAGCTQSPIPNHRLGQVRQRFPRGGNANVSRPDVERPCREEDPGAPSKCFDMLSSQLFRFDIQKGITMKFSSFAVAAVFLASRADAFAGPQIKPRFGIQVRLFD